MVKANFRYYQGKYFQGNLTDNEAMAILTLVNDYEELDSLTNCVKNLTKDEIKIIKDSAETYIEEKDSLSGYRVPDTLNPATGKLRPYQTKGVGFMYYAQSALLGDEVGLGKTVQIAGLMNLIRNEHKQKGKSFRGLFLGEKSTVGQLQDKLIQFTGEYIELIPSGEGKNVKEFLERMSSNKNISVVGTHSLMNNPEFITYLAKNPFDLLVFDESSALKNTSSQMYQSCKTVFRLHKRIVLLNGTPVEISIRDMYNQLDLLDPDYMPTVKDFNKQFSRMKRTAFGFQPDGFKNEEIFRHAVKLRYLARTRAQLGAVYEGNRYKTILIPLTPTQKKLNSKTTLKHLVANYPTKVDRNIPFNKETTSKLAVLEQIIQTEVIKGETQGLIFAHYVDSQEGIKDMFEKQGYRVCILNGRTKQKDRTRLAEEYDKGQYDIMITNVLRGLDLNSSDVAIVYSIDPNPSKMVQFEGRMTRDFDVRNKATYLLVSMGKEKELFEGNLKMRADASAAFATVGNSMVLKSISTEDNKVMYESEEAKKERYSKGQHTMRELIDYANKHGKPTSGLVPSVNEVQTELF